MTRRQKIVSLLLSYLQGISVSEGYLTDTGAYVSHWDTQVTPHGDAFDVNLMDTVNDHAAGHTETLNIKVSLVCNASADTYTTLTNMIQDIHKAFNDNTAVLGAEIGQQVRWMPVSEPIELTRNKDTEKGQAVIELQLEHKFDEKWVLDETVY